MEFPQHDDYRSLFLNDTPLLDVRAPVEFFRGAFPCAENGPLMNDQERTDIGTQYKKFGPDKAIKRGHQLIQGEIKSNRVSHWTQFTKQHPHGVLYCFRGGLRSKISQQWIYEKTGVLYPRIKGGYKAMRRFLIEQLDMSAQYIKPVILSGRTGIGKTLLLKKLDQKIDLEGIFHHRGSVFGKHVTPQPSQIDIENRLSITLLKYLYQGHTQIVLEDEGNNIGSRSLPKNLFEKMQQSPIVLLETRIEARINIIFQEYIIESLAAYCSFYAGEQAFSLWTQQLLDSINSIQRRLGGVRHKELTTLLISAIEHHRLGDIDYHKEWIKVLLVEYYDPMYDYQLAKKKDRVIFKGYYNDILDYLTHTCQIS